MQKKTQRTRKMNNKTAKEIFWEYSCNHFFLDHDGLTDEYVKKGGGNKSEEEKWRKEYIDFWFNQISDNEIEPFRKLTYAGATEILNKLIKYNSFRDDYIKFWYAYELLELSKSSSNIILKAIAKQRSKNIFKELVQQNIQLLDDNRNQISNEMIEAMNAKNPEDYIKNYSQRMISKSR